MAPTRVEYVLEELCNDSDCRTEGTHWHPFDSAAIIADGAANDHGMGVEYTITVRVRKVESRKVVAKKSKPLRPLADETNERE